MRPENLSLRESPRVRSEQPAIGSQEAGDTSDRSPSPVPDGEGIGNQKLSEIIGVPVSTIEKWKGAMKRGESIEFRRYPNFAREWTLGSDGRWYRRGTGETREPIDR